MTIQTGDTVKVSAKNDGHVRASAVKTYSGTVTFVNDRYVQVALAPSFRSKRVFSRSFDQIEKVER